MSLRNKASRLYPDILRSTFQNQQIPENPSPGVPLCLRQLNSMPVLSLPLPPGYCKFRKLVICALSFELIEMIIKIRYPDSIIASPRATQMTNKNTLLIFPPYSKSVYGYNPTHAFFFKINSYSTRTGLFFQIRHTDRNVIGTAQSIGNLYDAVTGIKAITALKDNLMKLITVDNLVCPVG